MQATKAGGQGRSCTTLRLSCSPCTWNKYSTPAATGRLQGCSNWHVAGIYKQCQVPSYREMQGGRDSHRKVFATGHGSCQMRRVFAVSCSDLLDRVLVAAWRTHGVLGGLLLGGSLRLASFPCSRWCHMRLLRLRTYPTFHINVGIAAATQRLQQLLQHSSCSCCNTAVAGMHSLGGWLLGHALHVEHCCLAWLFTLRDAHVTTAAFNAITWPMEACP